MKLDISKHGDILEQTYYQVIQTKLPAYEEIWKRYIGNDGQAKLIDIDVLTDDEKNNRIKFSQYHYSAFESIICIKELIDEANKTKITDIQSYLKINNMFLAFQAHCGRIRDCVKRMGELFGDKYLYQKLDEYYEQRNEALHGCKIPFMVIEGFIAIMPIKGKTEDNSKWNNKKSWQDVNTNDFNFLSDYMNKIYEEICSILNSCLYQLLEPIESIMKTHNMRLEPNKSEYPNYNSSGIQNNHFYTSTCFSCSGSTGSIIL